LSLQGNPRKHATWLASRPRRFEKNAVRALIAALRATSGNATKPGFSLHIVHLAGAPQALCWHGPGAHGCHCLLTSPGPASALAGSTWHAAAAVTEGCRPYLTDPLRDADADLLPELAAAKAEGLPLTVETCPHYLNFASERVKTGDTR
jgi:hypothetical protein